MGNKHPKTTTLEYFGVATAIIGFLAFCVAMAYLLSITGPLT